MSFLLEEAEYTKIKLLFREYPNLITEDFEMRIKKSINVLHYSYLWGACKEAKIVLTKYPNENLFALIMNIYSKKRKIHQTNFFLLHCFENALQSTIAIKIANLYNRHNCDDWFLTTNSNSQKLNSILNILKHRKKYLKSEATSTWEVFDCFNFGDLEKILSIHWQEFSHLFKDKKEYKKQNLPSYGTKEHLLTKIGQIRKARNEIFHNKPTKIKFKKDLEILLLRLGYNLEEAIQSNEISTNIDLCYKGNLNASKC